MSRYNACIPCKSIFPATEVNCYGCGEKLTEVIADIFTPPTEEEMKLIEEAWNKYKEDKDDGKDTAR